MSVADNNNAVLQSILETLMNSTATGLKNTFGFSFNETDLDILYKFMQDYVRRKNEMNEEIKIESLTQLIIEYVQYYADRTFIASQEFELFINPTGLDDKYKKKQNPPLKDLIKNKERGRALKENIKALEEDTKIAELEEEIEVLTRQRNEESEKVKEYMARLLIELTDILYTLIENTFPSYYDEEYYKLRENADALILANASRFDPANVRGNEDIIKDLLLMTTNDINNALISKINDILEKDDILDQATKDKILEIIQNNVKNSKVSIVIIFNEFMKLLRSFREAALQNSVDNQRILLGLPIKSFPFLEDIGNILVNFLGNRFGEGNNDSLSEDLKKLSRIASNSDEIKIITTIDPNEVNFNDINNAANSNIGLENPDNLFNLEPISIEGQELEMYGKLFNPIINFINNITPYALATIQILLVELYTSTTNIENIDFNIKDKKNELDKEIKKYKNVLSMNLNHDEFDLNETLLELSSTEKDLSESTLNLKTKFAIGGIILVGLFLLYKNNFNKENETNIHLNIHTKKK
jgi:hypothetical protein